MSIRQLPRFLPLLLVVLPGLVRAEVTIESIERRVEAQVTNLGDPLTTDWHQERSFDPGPLFLGTSASIEGNVQAYHNTDLLTENGGLTLAGICTGLASREDSGTTEVYSGYYLTILVFVCDVESEYSLSLRPENDPGAGELYLIDTDGAGTLIYETIDEDRTYTGMLTAGHRYILHIQGGASLSTSDPFETRVDLHIDFAVTPGDPVSTDECAWSEVKALFE